TKLTMALGSRLGAWVVNLESRVAGRGTRGRVRPRAPGPEPRAPETSVPRGQRSLTHFIAPMSPGYHADRMTTAIAATRSLLAYLLILAYIAVAGPLGLF